MQQRALVETRAADELARRRIRAVGRCPDCGRRVELQDEWLRVGDEPWHYACAYDAAVVEEPLERRRADGAQ